MARKTKAEAETTRTKLLDAAEILFSARGVTNTSLADIATAAGMTRGAIYWHFKNKVDLFKALHERIRLPVAAIESAAMAGPDPVIGLRDYWTETLLKIVHDEQHHRIVDILFRKCEYVGDYQAMSIHINEWISEIVEAMTRVYAKAEINNGLPPGLTPESAARATFSMVSGIIITWLTIPQLYGSDDDIVDTVTAFFNSLIISQPAPAPCCTKLIKGRGY